MAMRISLQDIIQEIGDRPWSPVEVSRVNDNIVRVALFRGKYHWHKHTNEDELFYVLRGSIIIEFKDGTNMTIREDELAIVPRGVEHCPKSLETSYVLMFEPISIKTQGD